MTVSMTKMYGSLDRNKFQFHDQGI